MAEQAVDAEYIARYERLKNALQGVELTGNEEALLQRMARQADYAMTSVRSEDVYTLAELIERARYAGPGGSSRTTVIDLPGRHRKPVPAVGPDYSHKERP